MALEAHFDVGLAVEVNGVDEAHFADVELHDERTGTHALAEEATIEQKKERLEAAKGAGVGVRPADTHALDEDAAKFGMSSVDYIYEQPPSRLFQGILPKYIAIQIFRALMENQTPFVMLGHVRLTALDRERPASFSPAVIGGLLRGDWRFQGVLITDDQRTN